MKRLLILLLPLLLAAQCQTPTPTPGPDPTPVPPPAGSCAVACARLRELGCEAAKPTEAGASCEAVCEYVNSSGTLQLDTGCVAAAASCEAADRCVR